MAAVELLESGPTVTAPTIREHPQLGRVLEVVIATPAALVVVDRDGVVHEASITYHTTEHGKEQVHQCGPGSSGGTTQSGAPPRPVQDPEVVTHRYHRLTGPATQVLGPALTVVVDTVDIEPIYVTGKACREIP